MATNIVKFLLGNNLILLLGFCEPAISATFVNVSVALKWHTHTQDTKKVMIRSDDSLRSYVGEFGEVLIQNQDIPKLVKFSVSNLPKVTHLHLTNCRIKKIEPGSFQNLPILTDLNLSNNLLEVLEDGIFDNLNFKTLYLENNKISTIGEKVFNKLQMEYLFIDDNRISEWKSEWFNGTPLVSISMRNNLLKFLPRLAFEYLWHFDGDVTLINFSLNNNKLTQIDPDAFEGVKIIVTLSFQNNSLTYLEPGLFDFVENIDQIDLSSNRISEIYYEVFRKTKVSHINLYDNFLNCVSSDIFNTTQLTFLNVLNNPISCSCVKEWSEWKSENKLPEITNFLNLQKSCKTRSATTVTKPIRLLLLFFAALILL